MTALHSAVAPAVDRLEGDRRHLRLRPQAAVLRVRQLRQAMMHGLNVIARADCGIPIPAADLDGASAFRRADALDAAVRELSLTVHVQQTILEARRTEICYEDFHGEWRMSDLNDFNDSNEPSLSSLASLPSLILQFPPLTTGMPR